MKSNKINPRVTESLGKGLVWMRDHSTILADEGIIDPEQVRLTVTARDDAIPKLHAAGLSQRQIAAAVGCGVGTVNRALNGMGSVPNGTKSVPNGTEDTKHLLLVRALNANE